MLMRTIPTESGPAGNIAGKNFQCTGSWQGFQKPHGLSSYRV